MAHFAKIDNGTVSQVIVVSNDDCAGGDFPESEAAGQAFIAGLGLAGEWLQTSYHATFVAHTQVSATSTTCHRHIHTTTNTRGRR
jgi:hypothetical protein